MATIRIGCLGAARITPNALIKPAAGMPDVEVGAVAARDLARARAFAGRHGIPTTYASYDELLADPAIDAVYNPLPNGLHGHWTMRALEAGKAVLCEKPFTANAGEAEQVAATAERTGQVVMEAFHWRYHPLASRLIEIVTSGELGDIRVVEATVCFPLLRGKDIRWRLDLAGGALMDAGCYAVHLVRTLAGAEPRVSSATSRLRSAEVDRTMRAELAFDDGRSGRVTCSMWSPPKVSATVVGDRGSLKVTNPLAPHIWHRVTVRRTDGVRHERVRGGPTYGYQLAAFAAAVRDGTPTLTPPADSVATMRVIDDIYRAAGMEPRRPALT